MASASIALGSASASGGARLITGHGSSTGPVSSLQHWTLTILVTELLTELLGPFQS